MENSRQKQNGQSIADRRKVATCFYLFPSICEHIFRQSSPDPREGIVIDPYWRLKLPVAEDIAKSVKILTDACGLSLTVKEWEKGWLCACYQTKEVVISPKALSLIERYARADPAFVECGLKWSVRHEYWHTRTNPLFANRIIRNVGITDEGATSLIERQTNKKLIRELVGEKYRHVDLHSDTEKWKIHLIAAGILFTSVIASRNEPAHWLKNDCYAKVDDNEEFSFLSTEFSVLLNRALKEAGDEISCMAFRKELEQQR